MIARCSPPMSDYLYGCGNTSDWQHSTGKDLHSLFSCLCWFWRWSNTCVENTLLVSIYSLSTEVLQWTFCDSALWVICITKGRNWVIAPPQPQVSYSHTVAGYWLEDSLKGGLSTWSVLQLQWRLVLSYLGPCWLIVGTIACLAVVYQVYT